MTFSTTIWLSRKSYYLIIIALVKMAVQSHMQCMLQTKKLENKPNCIWLCDDSAWNQSV